MRSSGKLYETAFIVFWEMGGTLLEEFNQKKAAIMSKAERCAFILLWYENMYWYDVIASINTKQKNLKILTTSLHWFVSPYTPNQQVHTNQTHSVYEPHNNAFKNKPSLCNKISKQTFANSTGDHKLYRKQTEKYGWIGEYEATIPLRLPSQ